MFLQLVGINLHLFQYVGNGFSLITIQSWRNVDVVTGVMKDRWLRKNFACLSLAENVHKKMIRKYNQQFRTSRRYNGWKSTDFKTRVRYKVGSIDFKTWVRYNVGEYRF